MSLKIALILAVILQFATAIIALTLIKRTKTNIAWWLISAGFLLMAFRRVFEILQVYNPYRVIDLDLWSSWTGVFISIIMLLSLIFIKRIFNVLKQIDTIREQNENKVLSAIMETEQKERQHFAKELHDGLGPILSSVKMAISASTYIDNYDKKVLNNAEMLIDEAIVSLKDISNKLSPHILINFGLYKATKSFINKVQSISKPKISLSCDFETRRFSYNIEMVLYRIICELISNTLKHANAHSIFIDLNADETTISLKYLDDGIGFDQTKLDNDYTGMGYANIKSRVKSLNGNYSFYSNQDEGIQVDIKISLIKHEEIISNIS